MTLVTLQDFKHQLGVPLTGGTDDVLLTMKLSQATQLVIDYISRSDDADQLALIEGWGTDPGLGSPIQEPVPWNIHAAILQWATELYTDRGDDPALAPRRTAPGDPSQTVEALLKRNGRRPVFA